MVKGVEKSLTARAAAASTTAHQLQWQISKKEQATGADCGDGRNSSSRKRWRLRQLGESAMTGAVKFLEKQASNNQLEAKDCNKSSKQHCRGISMPWYNDLAMTTGKTSGGSIGRGVPVAY